MARLAQFLGEQIVQVGSAGVDPSDKVQMFSLGVGEGPPLAEGQIQATGTIRGAQLYAVTGYLVGGLSSIAAEGVIARVTDASSPSVGSAVVGGGTAAALVWYNGTTWTVIGV